MPNTTLLLSSKSASFRDTETADIISYSPTLFSRLTDLAVGVWSMWGGIGRSMSLRMGFEVSHTQAKPSVSIAACQSGCKSWLLLQYYICLCATIFAVMMIMN